jgi:hypothetical protein
MVVADLYVVRIALDVSKADPPLIVYRYGVLALPIASESVESVTGRRLQVVQPGREIHILELANRTTRYVRRETPRPPFHEQPGSLPVRKGLDHHSFVIRHVTLVNPRCGTAPRARRGCGRKPGSSAAYGAATPDPAPAGERHVDAFHSIPAALDLARARGYPYRLAHLSPTTRWPAPKTPR